MTVIGARLNEMYATRYSTVLLSTHETPPPSFNSLCHGKNIPRYSYPCTRYAHITIIGFVTDSRKNGLVFWFSHKIMCRRWLYLDACICTGIYCTMFSLSVSLCCCVRIILSLADAFWCENLRRIFASIHLVLYEKSTPNMARCQWFLLCMYFSICSVNVFTKRSNKRGKKTSRQRGMFVCLLVYL